MNAFEKGKLKDQKLKTTGLAKPEFKQQYLAPIRCLENAEQTLLLTRCKNKEISLAELKKEANSFKQLATLKKNFVKLTNSTSWDDAVAKFPLFACEVELRKFTLLDLSKGIPSSFVDFCKRAKLSKDTAGSGVNHQAFVQHGKVVGFTIKEKPSELCGAVITNSFVGFQGADMIIIPIKPVSGCFFSLHLLYCQRDKHSCRAPYLYCIGYLRARGIFNDKGCLGRHIFICGNPILC